LIGFSLLIFYHPYFLGLAAFMALFLIFTWYFFGPDGVKAGSPEADGKYNVVSWIEELSRVRNIFTSDNGKSFSNNKINTLFNRWLVVRNRLFKFQFRQHIALQVFSVVMNILLLLLGGFLVLKQQLSTGQLVAAALVVNSIVSNIPNLQSFFFSVYNYSTSLDMIARFYDFPLEQEKGELLAPKSYDFKFDNLRFEPNYLFNFEYKERSKNLIFVKSFSSLEHFYDGVMGFTDQVSGNVMFDGKLIQDLDIGEIRNHIQLIAYDQFFSGTVLENLTGLGSKKLFTQTELQDVLMRVGLFENIDKLPQKLETQIRPNGFPFTKSQLLAIQVAKAILLQPKILMVTPDYEQISTYKRKLIYREILNRQNDWTLLFFTQRFHKGSFDRYSVLERNKMKELTGEADLLKEIENYV
jgi:ABC-type bacteriocin/lantibiotic exporter with double-glycine peptidase domain